jgi:hypothetical protein
MVAKECSMRPSIVSIMMPAHHAEHNFKQVIECLFGSDLRKPIFAKMNNRCVSESAHLR